MPKLDDPNFKLRLPQKFVRKNLRPWNIVEELKIELPHQESEDNSKQKVNNSETISKRLVNNKETIRKRENIYGTQLVNIKVTNSKPISKQTKGRISKRIVNQLVNNKSHKSSILDEIPKLSGLQLKLMIYILENCSSRGLLHTTPITNHTLTMLLKTDVCSVKTTIQRLKNKKLISRENGRPGRGGFCIFRITEEVRNAVIEAKRQLGFSEQIVNQLVNTNSKQTVNNQITNQVTNISSSSSVINNKKTTTSDSEEKDNGPLLSSEWETIEVAPLEEIGFSKHHLKQIASQNKISAVLVQESINAFAFDLKENGKAKILKTSPLNYLMGILRSGIPYSPPPNYESPEDKAMRLYLEQKRVLEQKRNTMEEELLQSEFTDWKNTLTAEEINEILPEDIKQSGITQAKTACLRTYYRNELWPNKRQEILKSRVEIN